ncbi:Mor transcription activator family protein [Turicibacter sanguinis]|uniref:Mor transcription activator family protein n=1 Tax=Turicibacter sanguinis TaxID=154288 RepID=UPI00232CFE55|nr:Mor transcription activator family protein [Turicibacter sanguinis]MDB8460307.1 Mor transcription activator family protein [Turicibacter sanguinis]
MMCQSTDYNGIYADIFEIFGDEIARQFHHHFKGHQICCPMRLHSKEYIRKYLAQYYDGKNIREIATYLGYSERWIKQLLIDEFK